MNDNPNSPARRKRPASPFRQSSDRKFLSTTLEKPFGMQDTIVSNILLPES
jgi:hypothetical protein